LAVIFFISAAVGFFAFFNERIDDGEIVRIRAAGDEGMVKFGFYAVEFFDGFGKRRAPAAAGVTRVPSKSNKRVFHFFLLVV